MQTDSFNIISLKLEALIVQMKPQIQNLHWKVLENALYVDVFKDT